MSRAMEKPQAQTVRHLLQSTNCYLVVRKEQFGAMGIHIPQKKWGASRSYCDRLLLEICFNSLDLFLLLGTRKCDALPSGNG